MEDVKVERRPFFKSVRNYFREYCNCSSIHGFRYFGEKRTHFERVWWFVVFSITLAACTISIREVYKKWLRSPVIVSFATKGTSIHSIPFPSVTICPETKSDQSLYSHTGVVRRNGQNLTEKEKKILDYMGLICDENTNIKYSDTKFFTTDFYETIEEINRGTNPFLKCFHMGNIENCSEIFKPIITDEGLCYSFNMLDRSEIFRDNVFIFSDYYKVDELTHYNWSISGGYNESASLYPYPRRALLAGAQNSLTVLLKTNKKNLDYSCKTSVQGYRVSLHIPSRVPRPSQEYFRVPLDEVVLAAIQPDMINTDESVKLYNANRRECFFEYEKQLKYFKLYTNLNCHLECLTNYTLHYCGCVDFFMPRENSTNICGTGSLECMKNAKTEYVLEDLRYKMKMNATKRHISENIRGTSLTDCNCMPLCSDLSYNVETSQSYWNWKKTFEADIKNQSIVNPADEFYISKLILFFKSSQFIPSKRHELYGPTDFLANFGGLLGLFTGFSILSFMEAIYFLTVRLCCNSRLYGYWAGPEK